MKHAFTMLWHYHGLRGVSIYPHKARRCGRIIETREIETRARRYLQGCPLYVSGFRPQLLARLESHKQGSQ